MKFRNRGVAGAVASFSAASALQFNTFWHSLSWCNDHLRAEGATDIHYCEEIGIGTLSVVKNGGGFRGGSFSEEPVVF